MRGPQVGAKSEPVNVAASVKPKAKRKVGRPKGAKTKVLRAGRRPVARGTAGLIRQLQAHQRALSAKHAEVEAQIDAVTGAIEALGSA